MRTLEHVQERRCALMQTHMLSLGHFIVRLRSQRIVIVLVLLRLPSQSRFKCRNGTRYLVLRNDALRARRLADDVEQLASIGFEHHDVGGRLRFESIQHVLIVHG